MALRIKSKYPNKVFTIFLMPRSKDKIYNNLKQMYSGRALLLREELVEEEICHSILFDRVFTVSDLLQEKELRKIILAERISDIF